MIILYQVWCIDNDFVAENGVEIQQRSIGGVLQRFFTENVWIFTKIRNTDNTREQLYFL